MHHSKIFLVDKSGQTWLPMTEMPYDQEVVLQEALAQYPDLIPGDQINPDNPRRWLLVQRELGIPGELGGSNQWSLDHLFLDQDGMPTFIECKRSQDTRGRREVVAQMLDYAANGTEYWPMEKLRQSAVETAQQQGRDLDQAIAELLDDVELDVEWFWQQVEANLRQGKIRLVFVADAIPKELRRLVEFLNAKMNDVEVMAVEVKQFLGEGQRAMVPRVIGITEATRQAKQGASSRIITREMFLENCLPETRSFYTQLIDRVITAGYEIAWRTKGFSMRMQGNGRMASFGYCFPPNIFQFYLGELIKYTDTPADQVASLRSRLKAAGLLTQQGQQTLQAKVTPQNQQGLLALLDVMFQTIES
ncbi:MAG: hypothetical protein IPM53_31450 [Anaerolineaceae bacterium]|nr:hypothetical protein [Anaerolineaceae bacterium]